MSCNPKSCGCQKKQALADQRPVFDNSLKKRKKDAKKSVIWSARRKEVKFL